MAKIKQWHQKGYCVLTQHGWVCESTFTFATGRIKPIRVNCGGSHYFKSKHKRFGKKSSNEIYFYKGIYPTITRWNRH